MAKEETEQIDEEENVYGENSREDMMDNDELSPEEDAFMKGYDEADEEEKDEEEKDEEEE